MDPQRTVAETMKLSVRNPSALLVVSLATSFSLLPFLSAVLFGIPLAQLAGLWTTCIFLGITTASGFELMTAVAQRDGSAGLSRFRRGIRNRWRDGFAIGLGTFVVALAILLLVSNPFSGVFQLSVTLFGFYISLGWWIWLAFALPVQVQNDLDLTSALKVGGVLALNDPISVVWLTVQSVGWTLLAVLTVVTPFVLLPGFLMLLAAISARSLQSSVPFSHLPEGLVDGESP